MRAAAGAVLRLDDLPVQIMRVVVMMPIDRHRAGRTRPEEPQIFGRLGYLPRHPGAADMAVQAQDMV